MYSASALKRLSEFVSAYGGLRNAARKLNVSPSTLRKVLQGKVLSEPTRIKLEAAFGTITEPAQNADSYRRLEKPVPFAYSPQTPLPLNMGGSLLRCQNEFARLKSFINDCGNIESASTRLGMRYKDSEPRRWASKESEFRTYKLEELQY